MYETPIQLTLNSGNQVGVGGYGYFKVKNTNKTCTHTNKTCTQVLFTINILRFYFKEFCISCLTGTIVLEKMVFKTNLANIFCN